MSNETVNKIIEQEYNDMGKLIHYKMDNDYTVDFEYDKNGNCTMRRDSDGDEEHYTYDSNRHIIDSYKIRGKVSNI